MHRLETTYRMLSLAVVLVCLSSPDAARGNSPWWTDDAAIVGDGRCQIETWIRADRREIAHHLLVAFGPLPRLEWSLGMVHGGPLSGPKPEYALAGPSFQMKVLPVSARDGGSPGSAFAVGFVPPVGRGAFAPPGWGGYLNGIISGSWFEEGLHIDLNLGTGFAEDDETTRNGSRTVAWIVSAGLRIQGRVVGGLHLAGEVFYGDPTDPRASLWSCQTGLRYVFSDSLELDVTIGRDLLSVGHRDGRRRIEYWGTMGLRIVSPPWW